MITERDHPAFIAPFEEDIVWRYMDFEKFKSLIENKSLFFCRTDRFLDPFEGSIPKREADYRIVNEENMAKRLHYSFNKEQATNNIQGIVDTHKNMKRATVANCWHINNNESNNMWQIYLKSNDGLSIKTTVKNIINALQNTHEDIQISKVRYIDYENAIWYHEKDYPCIGYNFYTPLVHKRIEFIHETELRLFHHIFDAENNISYWDNKENEKGIMISVDLNMLIDKIILHPAANEIIENKINKLLASNGINKEVIKSKLASNPIY